MSFITDSTEKSSLFSSVPLQPVHSKKKNRVSSIAEKVIHNNAPIEPKISFKNLKIDIHKDPNPITMEGALMMRNLPSFKLYLKTSENPNQPIEINGHNYIGFEYILRYDLGQKWIHALASHPHIKLDNPFYNQLSDGSNSLIDFAIKTNTIKNFLNEIYYSEENFKAWKAKVAIIKNNKSYIQWLLKNKKNALYSPFAFCGESYFPIEWLLYHSKRDDLIGLLFQDRLLLQEWGIAAGLVKSNLKWVEGALNLGADPKEKFQLEDKTFIEPIAYALLSGNTRACDLLFKHKVNKEEAFKKHGICAGIAHNKSHWIKLGCQYGDSNLIHSSMRKILRKGGKESLATYFAYVFTIDKKTRKHLLELDNQAKVSEILAILNPIAHKGKVDVLELVVYFECPYTTACLLKKRENSFSKKKPEWNILSTLAMPKKGLEEILIEAQCHLKELEECKEEIENFLPQKNYNPNIDFFLDNELTTHLNTFSFMSPFHCAVESLKEKKKILPLTQHQKFDALIKELKSPWELLPARWNNNLNCDSTLFNSIKKVIKLTNDFLNESKDIQGEILTIQSHYKNFIIDFCKAQSKKRNELKNPYYFDFEIHIPNSLPRILTNQATLGFKLEETYLLNKTRETCFNFEYKRICFKKYLSSDGNDLSKPLPYEMENAWNAVINQRKNDGEFVRIIHKNKRTIYLASPSIKGNSLSLILDKHPEFIHKIKPDFFSKCLIKDIIVEPHYDQLMNYKVIQLQNDKGEIQLLPSQTHYEGLSFSTFNKNPKNKLEMKSFFCFSSLMKTPIEKEFANYFCSISPEDWVLKWLEFLKIRRDQIQQLTQLPFNLPEGLPYYLRNKIGAIQLYIGKGYTHREIVFHFSPNLAFSYLKLNKNNDLSLSAKIDLLYAVNIKDKLKLDKSFYPAHLRKEIAMKTYKPYKGKSISIEDAIKLIKRAKRV